MIYFDKYLTYIYEYAKININMIMMSSKLFEKSLLFNNYFYYN